MNEYSPTRAARRARRAEPGRDQVGSLHSVETFGTLDGPGIRYVLFFQGCHLKCLFCQNRDTWERRPGRVVTVDEVMDELRRYRTYFDSSGGGVTASGGDPILQPDFVAELFQAARGEGIHTALDTSGLTRITPKVTRLLDHTDLALLDLKHIDPERHRELTGRSNELVLAFADHLVERGIPAWIRHVIVPGYTDDPDDTRRTARFIAGLPNVERVDLLPYHEYGKHKWEALGAEYPLEGISPPSEESVQRVREVFASEGLPVA